MEKTQVELIRECLSGDRTVFRYAPESYAPQLLKDYIGSGMGIAALRRSPYAKLFSKPIVAEKVLLRPNQRSPGLSKTDPVSALPATPR